MRAFQIETRQSTPNMAERDLLKTTPTKSAALANNE